MASLKRSDSKTLKKDVPPRSCVACTDIDGPLIRPCRNCPTDYCEECLAGMFTAATDDFTRMPPRCCHFIQIHTVICHLSQDEAKAYRAKFEEWIAPVKFYCPSPKCSAFVPERRLPALESTPHKDATPSLSSILSEIVETVVRDPSARFFRDEAPIDQLPGYSHVVTHPMHLGMIQINVLADVYKSTIELTTDMKLIVSNSTDYNGAGHPVSKAADTLFEKYLSALATVTDRLATTQAISLPLKFFPCPTCHIAICTDCKQIEHSGSPCDTSQADHEVAMLEQFGYKRCPRCQSGVKKMYGCPHMQCLCGAHWCYYCQRSIDQCDGGCDEGNDEDYEDENESDEDEEEEHIYTEAEIAAFNARRRDIGAPVFTGPQMATHGQRYVATFIVEGRFEAGIATAAETAMVRAGTAARVRTVNSRVVVLTATETTPAATPTRDRSPVRPTASASAPVSPIANINAGSRIANGPSDEALQFAGDLRYRGGLSASALSNPAVSGSRVQGTAPLATDTRSGASPSGTYSALMREFQDGGRPCVPPTLTPPAPTQSASLAMAQTPTASVPLSAADDSIVNLDRGGGRRWAGGNFDFGEEPQDNGVTQVWSCSHAFEPFKLPPEDGFDHGDFTRMECNRCFEKVGAKKEPPKRGGGSKKRRRVLMAGSGRLVGAVSEVREESQEDAVRDSVPPEDEAFECRRCRVVVCMGCKAKYHKERPDDDDDDD